MQHCSGDAGTDRQAGLGAAAAAALRQALADVIPTGTNVALRHSDPDHEDYRYFLLRVNKVRKALFHCELRFCVLTACCGQHFFAETGNTKPPNVLVLAAGRCPPNTILSAA